MDASRSELSPGISDTLLGSVNRQVRSSMSVSQNVWKGPGSLKDSVATLSEPGLAHSRKHITGPLGDPLGSGQHSVSAANDTADVFSSQ